MIKISSAFNPEIDPRNYNSVVAYTWANHERILDVIGGNRICPHNNVFERKCTVCGAFVGYWGEESNILDFYKHSYTFAYKYPSCDVYIVSEKIIPVEYNLKISGVNVKDRRIRSVVYSKRDNVFINGFLKKQRRNFEFTPMSVMDFLIHRINGSVLTVNPAKRLVGINSDIVISNRGIESLVENSILGKVRL